jgi:hypothetical protein
VLKNIKSKRLMIIVICSIVTILSTIGGSIAYLYTKTNAIDNSFEPVFVSCSVEETFDSAVKSNVKIKNTGDVTAYMRATIVITWTSDTGTVLSAAPVEGVDYSVVYGSDKWVIGSDGFYYLTTAVAPGASSDLLITSLTELGTAPEGFSLSVHVIATALQSEPARAVNEVWGASVDSNGRLIAP